jgi:DnaK suppressor protein
MFVSILQLMGFAPAKPVHSRADSKPSLEVARKTPQTSSVDKAVATAPAQTVQDKPARRSSVKAQAAKPKTTAKTAAVPVKPVKPAKAAKAVTAVKPVQAVKPAQQVPQGKAPQAKTKAVKPVAVKSAPVKISKAGAEPVRKPVLSSPKKKPQEVTIQAPVSPKTVAPAAAKPIAKPTVKVVMPTTQMTSSGVPVRTGRPSSRLAQLTVPSMAQAVASTAAKSSFTQMTSVTPIVSPLASSIKKDKKLANNWKTKPVEALTHAEVLAMPDDAYMNETQLAFFRLKLVNLKNDMLSNAGETTEHLREDTVVVPDPADRATIEEEHALELRTRDRERKLLKKIEQSITRIDAGDYGYCDETGEAIGVGRLLARPTATLSLEAQQRRELKQKMFGD